MKVYTGGGDKGKTSLFSGERVGKDHIRVEAYGDVDELSSVIGAIRSMLVQPDGALGKELLTIQSDLMTVGALLATIPGGRAAAGLSCIEEADIARLETAIDRMDEALPPLTSFILPGGHPAAAWSHVGRTVCRRAERRIISLIKTEAAVEAPGGNKADDVGDTGQSAALPLVQRYMNRLSDYLFVAARACNQLAGQPDIIWKQGSDAC